MRALIHRPGARFNRGRISSARQAYQMLAAMAGVYGVFIAGVRESYVTPTIQDYPAQSPTNCTPTTGQSDPDGGTGAILLTDSSDAANTLHYLVATTAQLSSGVDTYLRAWFMPGTKQGWRPQFSGGGHLITFDAADGGFYNSSGSVTGKVLEVRGSWYHLEFFCPAAGFTASTITQYMVPGAGVYGANYTGDGTGTVYVYKPELIQAGSTSQLVFPNYDPPTPVARTVNAASDISNPTYWILADCTTPDALTLLSNTDGSPVAHSVHQNISDMVAGEICTYTCRVTSTGTDDYVYLFCGNTIANGIGLNLSTGALYYTGSAVTAYSVTPLGGGSYDVSISVGAGWAGATTLYMQLGHPTTGATTFQGTGVESAQVTAWTCTQFPICQVTDPNDISTANWSKSNCTTPDTQTILDSSDSSAQNHTVSQFPPQIETAYHAVVYAELKSGTLTTALVQLGGAYAHFDLDTGTVMASGAGTEASVLGMTADGWWQCRLDTGTYTLIDGNLIFGTVAGGTLTYIGDGTGSIKVRNVKVLQPSLATFRSRLQTIDQSTFANMPLRDFLSTGARAMLFSSAAGTYMLGTLLASIPAPWGMAAVCKYVGSGVAQRVVGTTIGNTGFYVNGIGSVVSWSGGTYHTLTAASSVVDGNHLLAVEDDGAGTWSAYIDTASAAAGTLALASESLAAGGLQVGANGSGGGNWNDRIQAICIYDPSVADRVKIFSLLNRIAKRPI